MDRRTETPSTGPSSCSGVRPRQAPVAPSSRARIFKPSEVVTRVARRRVWGGEGRRATTPMMPSRPRSRARSSPVSSSFSRRLGQLSKEQSRSVPGSCRATVQAALASASAETVDGVVGAGTGMEVRVRGLSACSAAAGGRGGLAQPNSATQSKGIVMAAMRSIIMPFGARPAPGVSRPDHRDSGSP